MDVILNLTDHLEKLTVFDAVCRNKGFSSAAREMKRSQPAVSRAIKELEQVVGEVLLERSNKRFELSAVGSKLFAASQTILKTASDFEEELGRQVESLDLISIGTKEPIAVHIWADFVAWCKKTPDQQDVFEQTKRIDLRVDKSNRKLLENFASHTLDLLLIPADGGIPPAATVTKLIDTDWKCYVAKEHASPLETTPLIIYEQTLIGENRRLQDVVNLKDHPSAILRVNSLGTALALATRGLGATILPTWMAAGATKSGELRIFGGKTGYLGALPARSKVVAAYWKKGATTTSTKSKAISKLLKALQTFCERRSAD